MNKLKLLRELLKVASTKVQELKEGKEAQPKDSPDPDDAGNAFGGKKGRTT